MRVVKSEEGIAALHARPANAFHRSSLMNSGARKSRCEYGASMRKLPDLVTVLARNANGTAMALDHEPILAHCGVWHETMQEALGQA